jgi:hypothetical protein
MLRDGFCVCRLSIPRSRKAKRCEAFKRAQQEIHFLCCDEIALHTDAPSCQLAMIVFRDAPTDSMPGSLEWVLVESGPPNAVDHVHFRAFQVNLLGP